MAKQRNSKSNSNSASMKQQWEKMFRALCKKIQIISGEKQMYRDRLISDSVLYKEQISQMEDEIMTLEKIRWVDSLSTNLRVFMKHKDASIYKARLDSITDDLKDVKAAFDCVAKDSNASQISALISEKNFVWNQYKTMEEKFNSKRNEAELANEEMSRLREELEQLSSSNYEKDSTIQRLRSDVDRLENVLAEKSKEIELLKKAGNDSNTPSLRGCSVKDKRLDDKNDKMGKRESSSSQIQEKVTRSSKRKAADVTPQLFTSSFKVPKLKNPSPRVN